MLESARSAKTLEPVERWSSCHCVDERETVYGGKIEIVLVSNDVTVSAN